MNTVQEILSNPKIADILLKNPGIERRLNRAATILKDESDPVAAVLETARGLINKRIDVFISHKDQDKEFANFFVEEFSAFAAKNLRFNSSEDLWDNQVPGLNYIKKLRQAINTAHWFILLLTEPQAESWDWCLYDTGLFTGKIVSDKVNRIICLYHPDMKLPYMLSDFQSVPVEKNSVENLLSTIFLAKDPIPGMDPINPNIQRYIPQIASNIISSFPPPRRMLKTKYIERYMILTIEDLNSLTNYEIPPDTVVESNDYCLHIFNMVEGNWTWKDLRERALELGNKKWIVQLTKAIVRVKEGRVVPAIKETFFSDGRAYRSILSTVEELTDTKLRIHIIFTEDIDRIMVTSHPFFGDPKKLKEFSSLFMIMPFDERLKDVFFDHVLSVASEFGISAKRGDDFFTTNSIISDIWSAICQSDVIVADCTGKNPNVFYEIGIAHTLNKPTILISQSINDVPVDLRHLRFVPYEFTPRGMEEFEGNLKKMLKPILSKNETKLEKLDNG